MDELKKYIREVPDFPKPGINFYDITTLLKEPEGLEMTIDAMTEQCRGMQIDTVVGIESRGFIFGAPLAYQLGTGFVPVRKPKKLPHENSAPHNRSCRPTTLKQKPCNSWEVRSSTSSPSSSRSGRYGTYRFSLIRGV